MTNNHPMLTMQPDPTTSTESAQKKGYIRPDKRTDVENMPETAFVYLFLRTFQDFLKHWEYDPFSLDVLLPHSMTNHDLIY